jgi:hypothetical protein
MFGASAAKAEVGRIARAAARAGKRIGSSP